MDSYIIGFTTLKLENRNWKFGLHALLQLMNELNWGQGLISCNFLLSNFKFQAVNGYCYFF